MPHLASLLAVAAALVGWLALSTTAPAAAADRPPWHPPLSEVEVAAGFDPPAQRWSAGHRGVDLVGRPGAVVRAAGAGVVGFVGRVAGVRVVTVVHGALRTTYQPVLASVRRGQPVAAAAMLGRLGLAGGHCLPRACLHWGLLRGDAYLNPLDLLDLAPPRLLPLAGPLSGAGAAAGPRPVRTAVTSVPTPPAAAEPPAAPGAGGLVGGLVGPLGTGVAGVAALSYAAHAHRARRSQG